MQPIAQTLEGLAQITGRKFLAEVLSSLSLCIGLEDYSSSSMNYGLILILPAYTFQFNYSTYDI